MIFKKLNLGKVVEQEIQLENTNTNMSGFQESYFIDKNSSEKHDIFIIGIFEDSEKNSIDSKGVILRKEKFNDDSKVKYRTVVPVKIDTNYKDDICTSFSFCDFESNEEDDRFDRWLFYKNKTSDNPYNYIEFLNDLESVNKPSIGKRNSSDLRKFIDRNADKIVKYKKLKQNDLEKFDFIMKDTRSIRRFESYVEEKYKKSPFEIKLKKSKVPKALADILIKENNGRDSKSSVYVNDVLSLPWHKVSKSNISLDESKEMLDKSHYGMESVKSRIFEALVVRQMAGIENSNTILLCGPPGVGKTTIAFSIAEAMGKEVVKMSVGGIRNVEHIKGFQRTYRTASMGVVLKTMSQAKTKNPIFILDEIDKVKDPDAVAALLELLDPGQNKEFLDTYVEYPFDLSQVTFIATANYLENISKPLLNRMELIQLDEYTVDEKINIAKRHIIPKVMDNLKIDNTELEFDDDALELLITEHANEPGVRVLEQLINKFARMYLVKKLNTKDKVKLSITTKVVKDSLGNVVIKKTPVEKIGPGTIMSFALIENLVTDITVEVVLVHGSGEFTAIGFNNDNQLAIQQALIALKTYSGNSDYSELFYGHYDLFISQKESMKTESIINSSSIVIAVLSAFFNKELKNTEYILGGLSIRGNSIEVNSFEKVAIKAIRNGATKLYVPIQNYDESSVLNSKVDIISYSNFSELYEKIFRKS